MKPNKALSLILLAILICFLGMISVYFIGNGRGFDPSLWVLFRNIFIMLGFVVLWGALNKWGFKGDYTFLVLIVFLFSIGQIMQYRIKSDLDVGGRKKRQQQLQVILSKGLEMDTPQQQTKQPEIKKAVEEQKDFVAKLIEIVPNWWRVFFYSFGGMFLFYWIVAKYGDGIDILERRFFLWLFVTLVLLAIFIVLSKVGYRGRFVYKMTPWEFFKVTLIVILAGYLSMPGVTESLRRLNIGLKGISLPPAPLITWGPLLIILLIPQAMFVLLGDFGQVILFGGLTIVMIFAATRKWIYLLGGIIATIVTTKLLLLFGGHFLPGRRFARFVIWDNIWNYGAFDNMDKWWEYAYQMVNSFFALDAGGFWGTGLGFGYPTNIPLVISDFIYAGIAEELGFVGAAIVVFLYILLFLSGMKLANNFEKPFPKLLAIGFSSMLIIQTFVNIGGVINLIPMTGITLPFISRGGFSLDVCFVMVGFLMALSHIQAQQRIKESPTKIKMK